jgi:hypothetical protein
MDEIEPGRTYKSFHLSEYVNGEEIKSWTLSPPELLSSDLVAGLLAPLDRVAFESDNYNTIVVRVDEEEMDNDRGPFADAIPHYYAPVSYTKERIPDIFEDYFCWWGQSLDTDEILDLYTFRTPDFIRGFISMCNACQVDFREYVLGPPLKMIDGSNQFYRIAGYDISPIPPEIEQYLQPEQ